MLPNCKMIRFLKELESASEDSGAAGLAFVASAAVKIIEDINENFMSPVDIDCLADLVIEIRNEGYAGLQVYLEEDAQDCTICSALAERIKRLS
jgi:hypothetical protein